MRRTNMQHTTILNYIALAWRVSGPQQPLTFLPAASEQTRPLCPRKHGTSLGLLHAVWDRRVAFVPHPADPACLLPHTAFSSVSRAPFGTLHRNSMAGILCAAEQHGGRDVTYSPVHSYLSCPPSATSSFHTILLLHALRHGMTGQAVLFLVLRHLTVTLLPVFCDSGGQFYHYHLLPFIWALGMCLHAHSLCGLYDPLLNRKNNFDIFTRPTPCLPATSDLSLSYIWNGLPAFPFRITALFVRLHLFSWVGQDRMVSRDGPAYFMAAVLHPITQNMHGKRHFYILPTPPSSWTGHTTWRLLLPSTIHHSFLQRRSDEATDTHCLSTHSYTPPAQQERYSMAFRALLLYIGDTCVLNSSPSRLPATISELDSTFHTFSPAAGIIGQHAGLGCCPLPQMPPVTHRAAFNSLVMSLMRACSHKLYLPRAYACCASAALFFLSISRLSLSHSSFTTALLASCALAKPLHSCFSPQTWFWKTNSSFFSSAAFFPPPPDSYATWR